jgi:hypothetical protein
MFHPKRLPPSGLQIYQNIRWEPILGYMRPIRCPIKKSVIKKMIVVLLGGDYAAGES